MLHLEVIPITSKADSCNIIAKCGDDFDENMESTMDCIQCNRIPCLEDIIANIKTNNGDVFQIMQLFADSTGQEAKMDLKIKVKNNIPGDNFARTIIRGGTSNRPTIEIQMNKNKLNNANELFNSSVLVHELIHAYLLYFYYSGQSLNLFPNETEHILTLLDYYGNNDNVSHHTIIAQNYVPVVLQELQSQYPELVDFPVDLLEHLTWSPLEDVPNVFNQYYPPGSLGHATLLQDKFNESNTQGTINNLPFDGSTFQDAGPPCD